MVHVCNWVDLYNTGRKTHSFPSTAAGFDVNSGDIEDGPSLDSLQSFEVVVKGSNVFVRADEDGNYLPICLVVLRRRP